jgi:hypothetical protein
MKPQTSLIDPKIIFLGVVLVLVGALTFWQPGIYGRGKTFDVTSTGTVKALPDEYVFNPSYQELGKTSGEATSAAITKGNGVVEKLKELGVMSDDINTTVSAYQNYSPSGTAQDFTATFTISASVTSQATAEKVTAFLVTTGATSTITPYANFNEETRSKLELEARQKALDAAKVKATQTAETMGVRLGNVVSISDSTYSDYPKPIPLPYYQDGSTGAEVMDMSTKSSAPISADTVLQTGKQEITYTVTVTYRYY